MNDKCRSWTLSQKEAKSREVIREAIETFGFEKTAVAWSGGKDSTTVLHLIRQEYDSIPIKVLNIDTSFKFSEIYTFRDELAQEWDMDIIIARNEEAIKTIDPAKDRAECCTLLKTTPIKQAIRQNNWDALITAVRWDEQEARIDEDYLSARKDPDHMRIHPILHFKEADIWAYTRKYNMPYCELYDSGYRSLGCRPCTVKGDQSSERGGRDQEKEGKMQNLRNLGYF